MKNNKHLLKIKFGHVFAFIIILISMILLVLFIKGDGQLVLSYQNDYSTKVEGPFESSNSTSRYALTESIVKNHSFNLTKDLGKFSSPDVVYFNNHFFTIFTPGVSFIGIPFYLIGEQFNLTQLITYLSVLIFAVINIVLVTNLARKLGANIYAAILSGFGFIFATNALVYSLTYTQHLESTAVILLSILNALEERTFTRNLLLGFYFGVGLLLDIPNAVMLAPIILYVIARHVEIRELKNKISLNFKLVIGAFIVGLAPLIILFAIYNHATTGSFTKIGQTIGGTDYFKVQSNNGSTQNQPANVEINKELYLIKLPFKTRNELNGFDILLLSNERSWLFYSPIVLVGTLGLYFAYKNKKTSVAANLATAVVLLDLLVYSAFGDPWGGWAFGPRYLIPAAAIMMAAVGPAIYKLRKNIFFILIFFVVFAYSIYVSSLGALTTAAIPPKIEAVNLNVPIPYTYEYNQGFVKDNKSGNLVYNIWAHKYLSLTVYWYTLIFIILLIGVFNYILILKGEDEENV
ncbi:MAG TPA: hypothetical protein VHE53_04725 [Patescibacteria group bacterium]|nr:hypothetical protein [Patescibacteria group bacterium]